MDDELQLFTFDESKPLHNCSECGETHVPYKPVTIDYEAAKHTAQEVGVWTDNDIRLIVDAALGGDDEAL